MKNSLKVLFASVCSMLILLTLFSGIPTAAQIDEVLPDGVHTRPLDFEALNELEPVFQTSVPELEALTHEDIYIDLSEFEQEANSAPVGVNQITSQPYLGERSSIDMAYDPFFWHGQAVDLNSDGLLDFIFETSSGGTALNSYYQQPGGTFSEAQQIYIDHSRWAAGDFNNDGLLDIVYTVNDPFFSGFQFSLQQENSLPESKGVAFSETMNDLQYRIHQMEAIDVNNDGFDDVVMLINLAGNNPPTWFILKSDGVGGYLPNEVMSTPLPELFSIDFLIEKADLDLVGNDATKIVFAETNLNENGDGMRAPIFELAINQFVSDTLTTTVSITLPLGNVQSETISEVLDFDDVNQDGRTDIITALSLSAYYDNEVDAWIEAQRIIAVWLQAETGAFAEPVLLDGLDWDIRAVTFGDINLDGEIEMIAAGRENLGIFFLDANLGVVRTLEESLPASNRFSPFLLNDVNADGFPDLIIGPNIYYHSQKIAFAYLPSLFNRYTVYKSFFDDFDDPASGWPIFNSDNIEYRYVGSEYAIVNKNANLLGAVRQSFLANQYTMQVDGRKISDPRGGYGLLFEVDDTFDYFKGFLIFPDFGVVWYIDVNPEDGRLRILNEVRNVPLEEKGSYKFQVHRRFGHIRLKVTSLNGQPLAPFSDFSDSYVGESPHRVGLITLPLDDWFEVRFDDFVFIQEDQ